MSDTPEEEQNPLPVSAERRAEERGSRPGRPASRVKATKRPGARQRIGIRELRQHASVYVDLAERGYTVDITNRGRLVAQLVPVREPGSPLERLIAAGIIEPAEEPGGAGDIEPYPFPAAASEIGGQTRRAPARRARSRPGEPDRGEPGQGERR